MTIIARLEHLHPATSLGLSGGALAAVEDPADIIFYGGPILTTDDTYPDVDAVEDGIIVGVGTRAMLEADFRGAITQLRNLNGHTLIPGFVDAQSHFSFVGIQAISANLMPPADGPGSSIAALQDAAAPTRAQD